MRSIQQNEKRYYFLLLSNNEIYNFSKRKLIQTNNYLKRESAPLIAGQHELTGINNQNKLGYLLSILRGNRLPLKFTRNKYNRENYETTIISTNNGSGNETEERTN